MMVVPSTPELARPSATLFDDWSADAIERVDQCPLCGHGDSDLLYQGLEDSVCFCAAGSWTLYRCARCEAAYLNPRLTAATIGQAYANYHTHKESPDSSSPRGLVGRLKRALRNDYLNFRYKFDLTPALPLGRWIYGFCPSLRCRTDRAARLPLPHPRARLLDVGCGNGAFIRDAISWGWSAEGLDPDPDATAAAGHQVGARIKVGTLTQTTYPYDHFAAVTMDHTIEHLHEPLAALEEVYRILQPGGLIWIATPNIKSIGHTIYKKDWRGLEPPRHLVLFTAETLRAALTTVGYEEIEQLRSPFLSDWWFTKSYRIACGEDPLAETGTSLPLAARLSARIANWRAFVNPSCGEELIFMARKPSR